MIVNLDTIVPDGLVCPQNKRRVEYVDEGGTGLYVEVRATSPGQGTYYWRTRSPESGKTVHYKLARTTEIDTATARKKVHELRARQTLGLTVDTTKEARVKDASMTLDQAVQDYVWPYLRPRLRTAKKYEDMYNLRISRLYGSTPITDIRKEHLLSLHTALVRDNGLSPSTANRLTPGATVTAAAAETSLFGTGVGSLTLPANFFDVGRTIRVRLTGYNSTDATTPGTLTINIKVGGTTVMTTGARTPSVGLTNDYVDIIADIVCRSVGAPGSVIGQGKMTRVTSTGGGSTLWGMVATATTAATTTGTLAVDVTATWSLAVNSITITNAVLEAIH